MLIKLVVDRTCKISKQIAVVNRTFKVSKPAVDDVEKLVVNTTCKISKPAVDNPASIRGTLRNECAVENNRRTGNLQAHGLKTGHNTARLTTVALVDVDRQTSPVAPYPWREGSLEEAYGVGRRSWGWSGVCEKGMGHGLLPGSPSFTEKAEGSLRISIILCCRGEGCRRRSVGRRPQNHRW